MGLFGFGKKKTSAGILSDGRSQYVKGNLIKSLSILRDLADEGDPQACCCVGRIYLEQKDKSLAQPYLLTAAKDTVKAKLLFQKIADQNEDNKVHKLAEQALKEYF